MIWKRMIGKGRIFLIGLILSVVLVILAWDFGSNYYDPLVYLPQFFTGRLVPGGGTVLPENKSDNLLRVPQDYPTIQAAIEAAFGGSIIEVDPGIYRENLKIKKPLKLRGHGAILEANPKHPAVLIEDAGVVTLESLLIRPQVEAVDDKLVAILVQGSTRAFLRKNELQGWAISVQIKPGAFAVLEDNTLQTKASAQEVIGIALEEAEGEILFNKLYIESSWENVLGISASVSQVKIVGNEFFILEGSREIAGALFLTNCRGEISMNRITARRAEGVLLQGSQGLTIQGNFITTDSTAIELRRSVPEYETGPVVIQKNSLFGQGGDTGIWVDSLQQVEILENMVSGYEVGILFGFGSRGELKSNLIVGNKGDGVVIRRDVLAVLLQDNQILSNKRCGVRIEETLRVMLEAIKGEANWIAGNLKGDLCPTDYPWPPGFKK